MESHDTAARRVYGVTLETIVRRILRTFDRATASDVEAGASWYPHAQTIAAGLARTAGVDLLAGAALLSALSPRTDWARNVAGATSLAEGGVAEGCMATNVERGHRVLWAARHRGDVIAALGDGPKTRAFAQNIAGDVEAVTVDVWACRVADLDETLLSRKGAYSAVAHAYRLAARRRGVTPATMQATTWVVARNGRKD